MKVSKNTLALLLAILSAIFVAGAMAAFGAPTWAWIGALLGVYFLSPNASQL